MTFKDFVDPDPHFREMFEERMRDYEAQFPEPRSRADRVRIASERRRLRRELRLARGTAYWAVPPDEPH